MPKAQLFTIWLPLKVQSAADQEFAEAEETHLTVYITAETKIDALAILMRRMQYYFGDSSINEKI